MLFLLTLFACIETFPEDKRSTFVDDPAGDFDGDGQTEDQGD